MFWMNHCTRRLLPLLLPQTGTSGRVRPPHFSPLSVLLSSLLSGVSQRCFRLLWSQFPDTSGGSLCVSSWSEAGVAPPRRNDSAVKSSADGEAAAGSRSVNSSVMPSNVEIKAKVSDATRFAEKAGRLSQSESTIIRQHDTFFNCSRGRLKLRDFMDGSGQLIFYERPDTDGPKLSRYSISQTSDPPGLRAVLSDALGVKGEVRKERRLFLIGQTRVHLDAVEGLGDYMELEVVMRPDQSLEDGQQVAQGLMEQLGVSQESLVTGAYMDLLLQGRTEQ